MMERVDADGDVRSHACIDLEEFGELYDSLGRGRDGYERAERGKEEEEEGEMELREAFGVFDENGDGLITVEELGLVLASLGLKRGLKEKRARGGGLHGYDKEGGFSGAKARGRTRRRTAWI